MYLPDLPSYHTQTHTHTPTLTQTNKYPFIALILIQVFMGLLRRNERYSQFEIFKLQF